MIEGYIYQEYTVYSSSKTNNNQLRDKVQSLLLEWAIHASVRSDGVTVMRGVTTYIYSGVQKKFPPPLARWLKTPYLNDSIQCLHSVHIDETNMIYMMLMLENLDEFTCSL
jgi:hypothetical protein